MKQTHTCNRLYFRLIDPDCWQVTIDNKHSHYENGAGESIKPPSYEMLTPKADIKSLPPRGQWYEYGTEFSAKVTQQRFDTPTDPTNIVDLVSAVVKERDELLARNADLASRNEQLVAETTQQSGTTIANGKEKWRVEFDWDGNAGEHSEHWGFKNEKKAKNFMAKLQDKYAAYKFENVQIISYTIGE